MCCTKISQKRSDKKPKNEPVQTVTATEEDEFSDDSDSSVYSGLDDEATSSSDDTSEVILALYLV